MDYAWMIFLYTSFENNAEFIAVADSFFKAYNLLEQYCLLNSINWYDLQQTETKPEEFIYAYALDSHSHIQIERIRINTIIND